MNIKDIDLNLLRLFEAVHRSGNVSRAAESLGISQPAASQGLARLRGMLRDPLFVRTGAGVRPTPRADRLAQSVVGAMAVLEQALNESVEFSSRESRRVFRIHMSDIGEGRFLPDILVALRERAPGVRIETRPVLQNAISDALDSGLIDFAFGFLPGVGSTRRDDLLRDRYIILMREDHPFLARHGPDSVSQDDLHALEFVMVRTHANIQRILQLLALEDRLRLTTEHFLALPDIVRATDLCAVMPRNIARNFLAVRGGYAIIEPDFPLRDFVVSLHWSKRFQDDPGNRWFRDLTLELFAERGI